MCGLPPNEIITLPLNGSSDAMTEHFSMSIRGLKKLITFSSCLIFVNPSSIASLRRREMRMRFITVRGISPMDVARHLGVSRSLLYLRFMELENTSPAAMLQTLRLDALHAALRRSNRPVSELTRECGFSSVNYAKAVFKSRFGVTMHEARKTARR